MEYPKQWPTFFNDLISMLAEGPQAVDMFCRVLMAIDQDVVSLEIPRSAARPGKRAQQLCVAQG